MTEQDFLFDLGNRLKELRLKSGLSQEKFALKIEMDRTYYASVEAGKRNRTTQSRMFYNYRKSS